MSHVADGILHAYLDGALDALSDAGELPDGMKSADVMAHLAACADCRARLEAERRVRAGAGVILGDASVPHVEAPAFAGVAGARRLRRARWLPLGWAASVLLALGAGWWGSEVWRADRSEGVAVNQEAAANTARQSPGQPQPERASTAAPPAQRAEPETLVRRQASGPAADEQPSPSGGTGQRRTPSDAAGVVAAAPAAPGVAGVASAAASPRATADASGGREVREPIGFALSDAPAAREAPSSAARDQTVRSQDVTTTIPLIGASRAFTTVMPPAVGRMADSAMTDAQARAIVDERERAAFESAIALERSGRLPFRTVASSNHRTIEDQLFIVTDASAPVVEAAPEPGRTMVRVRQTLPNGRRVEIVTWREHAVELTDLIVTGQPSGRREAPVRSAAAAAQPDAPRRQESAAQQDAAAGEALHVISSTARRLEDGRRELVLRSSADGGVWIAIRADMSEQELRALLPRLGRP